MPRLARACTRQRTSEGSAASAHLPATTPRASALLHKLHSFPSLSSSASTSINTHPKAIASWSVLNDSCPTGQLSLLNLVLSKPRTACMS